MTEEKSIRIAILGATLETTNMGLGALAAGAIRCVLNAYPQADIFLLDYAKAPSVQTLKLNGRDVSINVINIRFSKQFYLSNNIAVLLLMAIVLKAIPSRQLRQWIISKNACLHEIQEMDVIASIAGGDSFSDIYGMERFLYVSLPQILALVLGRRLVLLPQTIGPFRRKLAKVVARYILVHADRVYSRDYRGLEGLSVLVGHRQALTDAAFCFDLGFVLDPIAPSDIDIVGLPILNEWMRPLVGLNVSGLLFMGGYTRDNMFGLRSDYAELTRNLIHFLIRERNASVLLIPHVFGTGSDSESDLNCCKRLFEELKDTYRDRLGVLRGSYNQNEIKYVIDKCDFFVGSRMHACIAAVSQCIPTVCVAYSDKFVGVMETIGVDSIVADARKLDVGGILDVVAYSLDHCDEIRQQLERTIPDVKSSVLNLFKNAVALTAGHSASCGADSRDSIRNSIKSRGIRI